MVSRRHVLAASAGTAAVWAAPTVVGFGPIAAAQASTPPPTPPFVFGGGYYLTDPPVDLAPGATDLESNTFTFVFLESACYLTTSPITANWSTDGAFDGNDDDGTVIPAGIKVCSWLVHGDRITNGVLTGAATFAQPVLGLIYENSEFAATTYLENPATNYEYGPMEGNDTGTFDSSTNTVTWRMRFGGVTDQIRIITAC